MRPIIKWVGGKSQLLTPIIARLPKYVYQQQFCLVEPFFGGGALSLWAMSNLPYLDKLIINDVNTDLITMYLQIQQNPQQLISELSTIQQEYDKLTTLEHKKPYFYQKRQLFNARTEADGIQAALFIFLNKTAFNGLYRVNKNNQFNVPIGSYKKPQFCDADHILSLSTKLQNAQIFNLDYQQLLNYLPEDMPCLFYIDPPYRPISTTSSFTAYNHLSFDDNEQIRLASFCQNLDRLGHCFIASNSDPKNTHDNDNFFEDIYQGFCIERISANRSVGATCHSRKAVSELLIGNPKKCYYE